MPSSAASVPSSRAAAFRPGGEGAVLASGDEELEREALRLCDRYVREVVLAFGLCPWAEPALRAGRVERAVCILATPTPADCLPFIDHFDHFDPFDHRPVSRRRGRTGAVDHRGYSDLDIGLLLFPRFTASWAAFDGFAERVRRADRERLPRGAMPAFLIAAFHPDGAETFSGPNQLVSFLRRSPDPLLQFVRADAIHRV